MSIVFAANRAPIRSTPSGWVPGLGGLASALLPVLHQRGGAWVAMREPGSDAPLRQQFPDDAPAFDIHRVPLDEAEYEAYYEGMANRVLWPLSHYLIDLVEPERMFWDAYQEVNHRFAQTVLEAARSSPPSSDVAFWVQDYQLMLVPRMLRAERPEARIGHFWHIPWPAPEVYRILPSARALLRGLLGADLLGFHTEGYAENFRASARDLLGATLEGDVILYDGREIRAQAYPIGIDVERFQSLARQPETQRKAAEFKAELGGSRFLVGIDRLDYTKGLLLRLEAFERFLELYPDLHQTVTFFQVATPSRIGVPAYAQLKRDVEEAVGRINGRFAEGAWAPVRYRYRAFDQAELAVLYAAADVAYVTPLRDGMNLVAHEFVAVNAAAGIDPGVLVLSELTGAADYLEGALLVNPYDTDGMAHALNEALHLSDDDRRERLVDMHAAVQRLNVHDWADQFIDALMVG